jgi:hypothetical protein
MNNTLNSKYKKLLITVGSIIIFIGAFFVFNSYIYNEKQAVTAKDFDDTEFVIEGQRVKLGGEIRYFGNELLVDLNDDGREDVVFLVTYNPSGSGTFYYVVAALNMETGYVGSDGFLLGDRIAPQTTEISQNPNHKNVIVINYTDRVQGEPMTTSPSVGKSTYLKLDTANMMWAIVEPNFEGEGAVLPPAGGTVTIRGEITCLPKRGTGPQTMECAIGLKGDDGKYYGLRNLIEHDPTYIYSQTGMGVEVSGKITYEEQAGPDGNLYDIIGVISVSAIQKR